MTWIGVGAVVLGCAGAILAALRHVQRELPATSHALQGFRAGVEPALVRLRSETGTARERLARHATRR